LPVPRRVRLRPADRFHVIVEAARALLQVSEVAIRKIDAGLAHLVLGALDEVAADAVADAARAAVEHEPDAIRLVEADLDEVVAAAERAELLLGRRVAIELAVL